MLIPLLLLAVPSVLAGFGFAAVRFLPLPRENTTVAIVPALATGAMLLGVIGGFVLYRNRESDPITIPLLRRKFYFDQFYAWLIRHTQGALASLSAFTDRWIIDGLGVRGLSTGTWSLGALLRLFQIGNLQAYAFLFGLGIVGLLYFTIFR
jgi:NADH-quinone oxidoreductase subunit L